MIHVVSAMAFGDCLVTLSLLERLGPSAPAFQVIGTGVTAAVSRLLRRPLPVVEMLPDKAAFYTIKERGPWAALKDLVLMRARLRQQVPPGSQIAFERRDVRNTMLVPPGTTPHFAPRSASAYSDRRALVESLFGPQPGWKPAPAPAGPVREVLINPCARYQHRWLSPRLMDNLVAAALRRRWRLTLVDPCARYAAYRERVSRYVRGTTLEEAAALLGQSDLYIGPDSFFVHLAYYFGVPTFGFFYADNLYFLLPGSDAPRGWCLFQEAEDAAQLDRALDRFLG